MIRATVDTNVLVTSVRRNQAPGVMLAPILRAWRLDQFTLILSSHILDELQRTLASRYFSRLLSPRDIRATIEGFHEFATVVPITAAVHGIATHPEDDLILATAISGRADYLVTLDRQLLELGAYGGVRIVTPQAFVTILAEEHGTD